MACVRGLSAIIIIGCLTFSFILAQGPSPDALGPGEYGYRHRGPLVDMKPPIPWGGFAAIQKNISYPDTALVLGLEGSVSIECTINLDGKAEEIRTILGPRLLFDAAILAVELSQWIPGRVDGHPVATEITFDLDFHLPGSRNVQEIVEDPIQTKDSLLELALSAAIFSALLLFFAVI